MADCCSGSCALNARQQGQRRTLRWVLAINAVMFVVIVVAALIAGSSALLADSLDNLGDAITYGLSLYAVTRGDLLKARVALFKGVLILSGALLVTVQIGYKLMFPQTPIFELMGIFSVLALIANSICLAMLWRHRHEDVNMTSVWECSRNDLVANLSVLVAALGVWLSDSGWPDLLVAMLLVTLLYRSGFRVIGMARQSIREHQG
ncbi:MAG: cation transporter [bacterium]